MKTPTVTREEFLAAIERGVENAVWRMITNATQMPCQDFYDTVRDAVEKALAADVEGAIAEGACKALTSSPR